MNLKKIMSLSAAAILTLGASVFAEVELNPYGTVQYRLRSRAHTLADDDNSLTMVDYWNTFGWRTGVRVKAGDDLSLQLQIGNDWAATEGVTWTRNNMPGARITDGHNLYVHLAFFKWDPGYLTLEGGVVPVNDNGTLDLLERSINVGFYGGAPISSWVAMTNSSLLGIRLGAPIVKGDVKVGAELFQSVINQRVSPISSNNDVNLGADQTANLSSVLMILNVPVEFGAFKITPEATAVLNRNYNAVTGDGDHEIIGGISASYKISDVNSLRFFGGFGTVSNENSMVGEYAAPSSQAPTETMYKSQGTLIGGTGVFKAGPGTLRAELHYNNAVNTENNDATNTDYIHTDLRYTYRVSKWFSITPRYRNYVVLFPEETAHNKNMRMENRFELIFEGAF